MGTFVREAGSVALQLLSAPEDPHWADVTGSSYWHPNGFRKVVLRAATRGESLVVHHWLARSETEPDIHNHRWYFETAIVLGRHRIEHFELCPLGSDMLGERGHLFGYRTSGKAYSLESAGEVYVRRTSVSEIRAGSEYGLQPLVLHRVTVLEPSLTVVRQAAASRDRTEVIRPVDRAETSRAEAPGLTRQDLVETLGVLSRSVGL